MNGNRAWSPERNRVQLEIGTTVSSTFQWLYNGAFDILKAKHGELPDSEIHRMIREYFACQAAGMEKGSTVL